jgi:hypothetical protein
MSPISPNIVAALTAPIPGIVVIGELSFSSKDLISFSTSKT